MMYGEPRRDLRDERILRVVMLALALLGVLALGALVSTGAGDRGQSADGRRRGRVRGRVRGRSPADFPESILYDEGTSASTAAREGRNERYAL